MQRRESIGRRSLAVSTYSEDDMQGLEHSNVQLPYERPLSKADPGPKYSAKNHQVGGYRFLQVVSGIKCAALI